MKNQQGINRRKQFENELRHNPAGTKLMKRFIKHKGWEYIDALEANLGRPRFMKWAGKRA